MEVVIGSSPEQIAGWGADIVEQAVLQDASAVLGLATGSSPLGLYRELGRRVQLGRFSLAGCTGFLLDEYVGLPAGHPQSYAEVIRRELMELTDLREDAVHAPQGVRVDDLPAAAAEFEAAIQAAGGVDVQILGLGSDGHIAFNEPGSSLGSRTRVKTLTPQTRKDNARFFDDDPTQVPTHCLTQGIATILDARHLVVLALGPGKATAVAQLVEGAVSARWPATALQLHPHVTVLVDEAAAAKLDLADYYRQVWDAKPPWQGF
ncbi:MAG: glucosamine-6-phosphate deaminase [Micrococcus sp.]|nr:glucosamine-6-phosphate deaminase [Micrococcus sp.]